MSLSADSNCSLTSPIALRKPRESHVTWIILEYKTLLKAAPGSMHSANTRVGCVVLSDSLLTVE